MSGVMGAKVPEGEAERTHGENGGVCGHTPGPWAVFGDPGDWPGIDAGNISVVLYGEPDEEFGVHGNDSAEAWANARLIAAAPDMLEALENLENDDNSIPAHAWQMVQAAIAKARGQG